LSLLKRRPEPDVAANLLIEAGLLRRHDPLPLLRLGRSMADFDPSLEGAAEVRTALQNISFFLQQHVYVKFLASSVNQRINCMR
jgi:hypothetical protein